MSSCEDDIEMEESNLSERCSSDLQINVSTMIKSHFFTLDLSRRNLHNLPVLMPRVQRLVACDNMLAQLPPLSVLRNLHYVDLSGNYIETVPRSLNDLPELDTLKLSSNLITRAVALLRVRVYHLLGNPIQELELGCAHAKMEQFGFDWLAYLDPEMSSIWQDRRLLDWKSTLGDYHHDRVDQTTQLTLASFLEYFLTEQQRTKMMKKNICNAIHKKDYEFFQFLPKMLGPEESPEEYEYDSKLLFELALQQRCEPALDYFKKQKFTKSSGLEFLNLTARYSNLEFFNLMIKKGHSIHQSYRNSNSPLHELISNFDTAKSPAILHTLLKFLLNSNCKNQKKLNCLVYSAMKKPHCFSEFLRYLKFHQELVQHFNFDEVCGVKLQENVLHLAARQGEVQIVKNLLELKAVDPFVRNSYSKRAKNITSHYLIRKLLAKYERHHLSKTFKMAKEYDDISEEVLVSLPSLRISESASSCVKSLQLELKKSLELCDKIRLVINLLYCERQQIYDCETLQDIIHLGFQDAVLRDLVLSFLQRQHFNKEFIAKEVEHCYRQKLSSRSTNTPGCKEISDLQLFQQMQTVASSSVSFRTQDSPIQSTFKAIKPFSFPLCSEVEVASESVITVEPKFLKTFRDFGCGKKQQSDSKEIHHRPNEQQLNSTLQTTVEMGSGRRPYINNMMSLRAQTRRLSLTFIR